MVPDCQAAVKLSSETRMVESEGAIVSVTTWSLYAHEDAMNAARTTLTHDHGRDLSERLPVDVHEELTDMLELNKLSKPKHMRDQVRFMFFVCL